MTDFSRLDEYLGVAPPSNEPADFSKLDEYLKAGAPAGTPTPGAELAPPEPGYAHHLAGLAGETAIRAGTSLAGLPGNLQHGVDWAFGKMGAGEPPPEAPGMVKYPTSEEINKSLEAKGVLGNFQPRGRIESLASGLGEELPIGTLTGMGMGQGLKSAAAQVLGGFAGSHTASAVMPESEWAPLLGGVLGGAATGLGESAVRTATVKGLGGKIEPPSVTGTLVQEQLRNWLKSDTQEGREAFLASGRPPVTLPELETTAWEALRSKVPGMAPVSYDNTRQTLQDLLQGQGFFSSSEGKIASGYLAKQLKKIETYDQTAQALGTTPATSWDDMKAWRTWIGDRLHKPDVDLSLPEEQKLALYSAVTEDMKQAAAAHGAEAEFNQANAASQAKHDFIRQTVAPHIAGERPMPGAERSPEATTIKMTNDLKKGASEFNPLQSELPEAGQAVQNHVRNLVVNDPKLWPKLPQDTKNALYPEPWQQEALDNLAKGVHDSKTSLFTAFVASQFGKVGGALGPALLGHANWSHVGSLVGAGMGIAASTAAKKAGRTLANPLMWKGGVTGGVTGGYGVDPNAERSENELMP